MFGDFPVPILITFKNGLALRTISLKGIGLSKGIGLGNGVRDKGIGLGLILIHRLLEANHRLLLAF